MEFEYVFQLQSLKRIVFSLPSRRTTVEIREITFSSPVRALTAELAAIERLKKTLDL